MHSASGEKSQIDLVSTFKQRPLREERVAFTFMSVLDYGVPIYMQLFSQWLHMLDTFYHVAQRFY